MSKEAASRSLDYRLRADTLDRIKGAAEAGLRQEGDVMPGDALIGLGQQASVAVEAASRAKEAEKERHELAVESFNTALDNLGSRQSAYSTNTFDQAKAFEEGQREAFLAADKKTQETMLKEMGERNASIQGMKEQVTILEDVMNPVDSAGNATPSGLDLEMLENIPGGTAMLNNMKELISQKNTVLKYDEDNEAYFEYGDPPQQIYKKDVTSFIEMATKPANEAKAFGNLMMNVSATAMVMPAPDPKAQAGEDFPVVEQKRKELINQASDWVNTNINENNAGRMMNSGSVFMNNGKSFRQILQDSDALFNGVALDSFLINVENEATGKPVDINNDGKRDADDTAIIVDLIGNDRDKLISMIQEDVDLFRMIVMGYVQTNVNSTFDNNRATAPIKDRLGSGSLNK
tara:strand:+ start:3714 stop:4928 length:1215 start_codon:yes stop_codon:yes gene_type:complete